MPVKAPDPIEIKFVITECEQLNAEYFYCNYEVRSGGKIAGGGRLYFKTE